jgi:hypothetical protein
MIKQFGSWQKVLDTYKKTYTPERQKYPDLKDIPNGEQKFKELSELKSEKGRFIYPEISFNMPFTGVLYALDKNNILGSKSEIFALLFEERIKLAYSLKKMDDNIPDLPEIEPTEFNAKRILEYFDYYDIESLQDAIELFNPNTNPEEMCII